MIQQVFCEIAVRINDSNAVSGVDVLNDDVAKQGSFSRTCLAEGVDVASRVGRSQAKESGVSAPIFALAEVNKVAFHGARASRHSSHAANLARKIPPR